VQRKGGFHDQRAIKTQARRYPECGVEGYSRLMRENEEAIIRTLTTYRAAMTNLIQRETLYYIP
jgi:hypothetical protein